jgi:rhamnosyltransferase
MKWAAGRPVRTVQELQPGKDFQKLPPLERLALISFDNVSSCIRRNVWEEHPFPESSFGEDVAWASQVIQRGYRIIYEPSSMVIHSHNNSVWYEFKRIYADHQNLNRLIGLMTVPRFKNIFPNAKGAFSHYYRLIMKHETHRAKRLQKILRSFLYAFLENFAQYLGPRLYKRAEERGGIFAFLDKRLKGGI